ncbi:MAG: fumarylacetoacetase, partial [Pseudomonadota bacterium]
MHKQSVINETHDPALRSWIESANSATGDFPIQNLPFAEFREAQSSQSFRGGVAIGDQIVDLAKLSETGLIGGLAAESLSACSQPDLNDFMALGHAAWSALRLELSRALRSGSPHQAVLQGCLLPQDQAE